MADLKYQPVVHDHEAFLEQARKREGFQEAYDRVEDEYALARERLTHITVGESRNPTG